MDEDLDEADEEQEGEEDEDEKDNEQTKLQENKNESCFDPFNFIVKNECDFRF